MSASVLGNTTLSSCLHLYRATLRVRVSIGQPSDNCIDWHRHHFTTWQNCCWRKFNTETKFLIFLLVFYISVMCWLAPICMPCGVSVLLQQIEWSVCVSSWVAQCTSANEASIQKLRFMPTLTWLKECWHHVRNTYHHFLWWNTKLYILGIFCVLM